MRIVSALFLLLFLSLTFAAQEKPGTGNDLIATTEDGRKVLLRADGTWKFLTTIIVIIDSPAPMRPRPDEMKTVLVRIPVGKELAVLETRTVRAGMSVVRWHKVKYFSVVGWISEYCVKPIKKKEANEKDG